MWWCLSIGGGRSHPYARKLYVLCDFSRRCRSVVMERCSFAKQAVETLKITSYDLHQLGVIDKIIPEPRGGAHHDLKYQAKNIDIVLEQSLRELQQLSPEQLLEKRWDKYKKIGDFNEM